MLFCIVLILDPPSETPTPPSASHFSRSQAATAVSGNGADDEN